VGQGQGEKSENKKKRFCEKYKSAGKKKKGNPFFRERKKKGREEQGALWSTPVKEKTD